MPESTANEGEVGAKKPRLENSGKRLKLKTDTYKHTYKHDCYLQFALSGLNVENIS